MLPEYVSSAYLNPYIYDETSASLLKPITYATKRGEKAHGFEATMLTRICDIWINAAKNGALKTEGHIRLETEHGKSRPQDRG